MPGTCQKMMSEYDLGLRFHKRTEVEVQPLYSQLDLGNYIVTMTNQEIFNTFASVIDCSGASPFFKRIAQAGLVAKPEDKQLILKTWPEIYLHYGPYSALHKK